MELAHILIFSFFILLFSIILISFLGRNWSHPFRYSIILYAFLISSCFSSPLLLGGGGGDGGGGDGGGGGGGGGGGCGDVGGGGVNVTVNVKISGLSLINPHSMKTCRKWSYGSTHSSSQHCMDMDSGVFTPDTLD